MAKEVFHVLWDEQDSGQVPVPLSAIGNPSTTKAEYLNGKVEFTKAEAEEINPKLKEISVIKGRVKTAKFIEVEVEAGKPAQAALLVKEVVCNRGGAPTTNFITVKSTEWKEESPN